VLVELLDENIVILPPGNAPIVGKAAMVELLEEFPTDAYAGEHAIVDLLAGEQLSVV
jgi:hypothetical protein